MNPVIYRKILATVAVGAALGLPFTASAQQAREPELSFYAVGGWNNAATAGMCSISGKFNNGFDMRFSGGEGRVKKVEIDFHQDIFKKGQPYDVAVTLSGGTAQRFPALNTAPGVLSLDTGANAGLPQALGKASSLDLAIEQNNFRFYLSGLPASFGDFERCLGGKPAAAQETVVQAAGRTVKPAAAPAGESARDGAQAFRVNESVEMEKSMKAEASSAMPAAAPAPAPAPAPILSGEPSLSGAPEKSAGDIVERPVMTAQRFPVTESEPVVKKPALAEKDSVPPAAPAASVSPAEPVAAPVADAAPKAVAEAPKAQQAGRMVDPAPGLVSKGNVSPEQVSRLLAQQLENGGSAKAVAAPAAIAPVSAVDPAVVQPVVPEPEISAVAAPVSGAPEALTSGDLAQDAPAPSTPRAVPVEPVDSAFVPLPAEEDKPPSRTVERVSTPEAVVHRSTVKAEADFTREPDIRPAAGDAGPELSREVSALRKTIDSLQAENAALNKELKSMVRDSEQERLSISSENWNLEQATMKFNEAERQNKRLGMELQKERARCENDRKELEAMLFDPQLTNQQQLARLGDLERELARAKEESQLERQRYEERIRVLEASTAGRSAP